jgi:serine protease AprX
MSPSSFILYNGYTEYNTLTITSVNGFSGSVTLSVSEFPSGVSATASSNPVTVPANGSKTVTLYWTATNRAPDQTTTFEFIGTSGSLTNEIPVTIQVEEP